MPHRQRLWRAAGYGGPAAIKYGIAFWKPAQIAIKTSKMQQCCCRTSKWKTRYRKARTSNQLRKKSKAKINKN